MKTSKQALMSAINLYSEYFLGFVISLAVARNLSTDDYGVYSSIIWIAACISIFVNSGISISSIRYFSEYSKNSPAYIGDLYSYFRLAQAKRFVLVAFLVLGILWSDLLELEVKIFFLGLVVLSALAKSDYMFRTSIFKGIKRFDIIAKTSLIVNVCNLSLVLTVAYFVPSLENFLIAYCISCFIYFFSSQYYSKYLPSKKIDKKIPSDEINTLKEQVFFSTVIMFIGFFLMKQSQVFFLEFNNYKAEAGFFNIAYLLSAAAISLVPGVYQEILLPKISSFSEQNDIQSQIQLSENILLILALMTSLPVLYFSESIILILYGERYIQAAFVLQLLMVIRVVQLLFQGPTLTLIKGSGEKDRASVNVIALIIGCSTSILLVPLIGLNASIAIYGLCSTVMLFGYVFCARKFGYRIFDLVKCMQIFIVASISSCVMLIPAMFADNIFAIIVSTILFWFIYFTLICKCKLIDFRVISLAGKVAKNSPKPLRIYLQYCISGLAK